MRKTLLATVAAVSLIVTMPTAKAQFTVIDPANLVQNIQQVFQAIEEGIRTLRQIELAVQTVTGTNFAITPQLQEQIQGVQTVLNNGAAATVTASAAGHGGGGGNPSVDISNKS